MVLWTTWFLFVSSSKFARDAKRRRQLTEKLPRNDLEFTQAQRLRKHSEAEVFLCTVTQSPRLGRRPSLISRDFVEYTARLWRAPCLGRRGSYCRFLTISFQRAVGISSSSSWGHHHL